MPATAGRVRMPANNRVHSSAALQTHGIWQSAIGYDPYAPTNNNEKLAKPSADQSSAGDGEDGGENAYASFQGLLALARITGTNADDTRGACKKCGRVGHLTFQCRNFLSLKAGREKDEAAADEAVAIFHELKKGSGRKEEESEEEEGEEDESSDSDVDPEIEKIIAARYGKKGNKESERIGRSKKRSGRRSRRSDDEEEEEEEGKRKEKSRRRKEKRRYESSDDEDEKGGRHRKSRKEVKRRRSHKRRDASDDESDDDADGSYHHKRSKKRNNDYSTDSNSDGMVAARYHKRRRERRRERRRASSSSFDTSGSGSDVNDREKKKSFERGRRRNRKD